MNKGYFKLTHNDFASFSGCKVTEKILIYAKLFIADLIDKYFAYLSVFFLEFSGIENTKNIENSGIENQKNRKIVE